MHNPGTPTTVVTMDANPGLYGDWTPLQGRETLFDADLDRNDPWQFKNFRVD